MADETGEKATGPEIAEIQRIAIEQFRDSLTKFDCDVTVKEEKKGLFSKEKQLVIEQTLGDGLVLGYDDRNLWVSPEVFRGDHYWNTNAQLEVGREYKGMKVSEIAEGKILVEIGREHPVSRLVVLLNSRGWRGRIAMTGEKAGWNPATAPEVTVEAYGRLKVETFPGESKLVLIGVQAEWHDAKWLQGRKQKLVIK